MMTMTTNRQVQRCRLIPSKLAMTAVDVDDVDGPSQSAAAIIITNPMNTANQHDKPTSIFFAFVIKY